MKALRVAEFIAHKNKDVLVFCNGVLVTLENLYNVAEIWLFGCVPLFINNLNTSNIIQHGRQFSFAVLWEFTGIGLILDIVESPCNGCNV